MGQSTTPGWFAICGLPSDAALEARAFAGGDSSGFIEIDVPSNGLRHVTFLVGGASLVTLPPTDTVPGAAILPETAWRGRARLTGTVTDSAGKPVVGAHATVWGTKLDAATNDRGMFTLSDLPGGTHTLNVRAVGYAPRATTVHLAESRPATTTVVLGKPAEILSTVTVRGQLVYSANLADFNRRRRTGFGQFRTSDEIARRGKNAKLSQLLQDVLGVRVQTINGRSIVTMQRNATQVANVASMRVPCTPSLYVDGRLDIFGDFDIYYSDEIAGIEVYREHNRPFEFLDHRNACGTVAIWTRDVPKQVKKK
jgi:hypothetical protein